MHKASSRRLVRCEQHCLEGGLVVAQRLFGVVVGRFVGPGAQVEEEGSAGDEEVVVAHSVDHEGLAGLLHPVIVQVVGQTYGPCRRVEIPGELIEMKVLLFFAVCFLLSRFFFLLSHFSLFFSFFSLFSLSLFSLSFLSLSVSLRCYYCSLMFLRNLKLLANICRDALITPILCVQI